ncbi:MAG: DNA polymerase Y family protein, partial [Chloroflexi bacterium]|nr:DNA polymerase Y family protein [Chloroflexota bacterium]
MDDSLIEQVFYRWKRGQMTGSFLLSGVSVCCVRMPQLALRVEVLRHPAWDGHPLVLGPGRGEPRVVKAASPEAERAGIAPGLPLREVTALAPDAIVVSPDPVRMAAVMDRLIERLQRVSPALEAGDDEVFVDLRGLSSFYGDDLARLERALRAALPALLRPRLGAAAGKFAAGMAARATTTSTMRVVTAGETAAFLAPLAAAWLPLPPQTIERLARLGIRTMGQLAALPFHAVQAQLGPLGARAWRLATGRDDERVVPRPLRPTVRVAMLLDDPLASEDALLVAVRDLASRA